MEVNKRVVKKSMYPGDKILVATLPGTFLYVVDKGGAGNGT